MQEGKDAVQTVFVEQAVDLRHARLGADVLGQGVQGSKRLACLGKEGTVGVYVQMHESVLQVADALAQALEVGKEQRVLVAVLPDILVESRLHEGIAPYHEVLCGERVKGMCLAVRHGEASGSHRLVGPPEFAPLGAFLGVLHAAVVDVGRMLLYGIQIVADEERAVHLRVAIYEENPFARGEFEEPVADARAPQVLAGFEYTALLHAGYSLERPYGILRGAFVVAHDDFCILWNLLQKVANEPGAIPVV